MRVCADTKHVQELGSDPKAVMGRLIRIFVLIVSLTGLGAWGGNACAVTITSTTTGGLWSAATTWVGGVVPTTQNVVIATTGANAVTLGANTTFAPTLTTVPAITINAGSTLNLSTFRLRVTGVTSISGTLNVGTNTGNRFAGLVTLNAGGVWTNVAAAVDFRGGLTNNGGTFTAGTGVQTFSTAAQAIGGTSPISIAKLTVTTIALTNNGTLTVPTALAGTGSLVNSATGTLNLGGTSAITTLTANAVGNTVNYTGAAQTVKAAAYSNLGLGGSGAKTLTGVSTVGGNLTMSGTATATLASAMTVGGNLTIGATNTFGNGALALNVAGDFTQSGTFTAGAGMVTLNGGAAVQTITGTLPAALKLTVSNTGGITLTQDETLTTAIVGAVTLTSTCPTNWLLTHGGAVLKSCPPPPTVVSITRASANPATAGTAVAWTVVFSSGVTGVTAANFGFAQSGNVTGATITSVTGATTTWTVNANTGSGAGTLGLNLVNVTGIAPAMAAATFTGELYTVYPPLTCISDNFTGANNSPPNTINWDVQRVSGTFTPVIFGNRLRLADLSVNAGTRATSKNIFPFGNNVVTAEFDYWAYGGAGVGGDGIAVAFSDPNTPTIGANNPPTAGGFGGSLGYANRDSSAVPGLCNVAGFSGGWIGVGIDEYGNYTNPTECRNGGTGLIANAVAIRGSGSGAASPSASNYAYLTGTSDQGVNGVTSGTTLQAYRYRITLDSVTDQPRVWVRVELDKTGLGTSYLPLLTYDLRPQITAGMQVALPSQLQLTFTGSTGAANDYHEIDNVSVCAAVLVSVLNHIAISAPATEMTGVAVPVILTPHDASHAAMSNAGTINLSTSTGLGDWTIGSGTGTLTPGAANSGMATYVFGAGETSASLDFTYRTAGTVTLNVANVGGADLLLNTPAGEKANTITFTVPGYVFTDSACVHNIAFGAAGQTCKILNWPTHVAGLLLSNVYITTLTGGVPTRLSGTKVKTVSMQFGLSCHDPVAGAGKVPTFTATAQVFPACQANGAMPATWSTAANISFPAGSPSAGPFSFNYPDVGKVELWMQKAATTSRGASGAFVVKPGGFLLSAIQQTAAPNLANPAAADATGAKFVRAGEAFSATVTATTCAPASATCTVAGLATPNYGKEKAPESVKLTFALAPGLGLTGNPAIGGTFGAFAAGAATGTAFTWDEAGIITLTPSVASASYLGAGDVTGTISGNVGRFYPDHFDTTIVSSAGVPMACPPPALTCPSSYNGMVYSGQPFSLAVAAKSASGSVTQNYAYSATAANNFAKAVTLSAVDAKGGAVIPTAAPGGTLSANTIAAANFASGSNSAALSSPTFTFANAPTVPTDVYVRAVETAGDGVSSLRAVAVNSGEDGVKVVSGRVKVANAYGSELLPLTVQATAQYFTATGWVNSSTDSATSFAVGTIAWTSVKGPLIPGNLGVAAVTDACATNVFCNGVKRITLSNAAKLTGSADVCLSSPAFLQGTPACAAGTPGPNAGRATFGVYQGRKEFIYLRENY